MNELADTEMPGAARAKTLLERLVDLAEELVCIAQDDVQCRASGNFHAAGRTLTQLKQQIASKHTGSEAHKFIHAVEDDMRRAFGCDERAGACGHFKSARTYLGRAIAALEAVQ